MGWVNELHGKTVAIDTAPLIYYVEDHPQYANLLQPLFEAAVEGDVRLTASVITLLEVLVQPIKAADNNLAHEYNDLLTDSKYISIEPVTVGTAQLAAELRATLGLKSADALLLATAIGCGADAFLTNDRDFGTHDSIRILKLSELLKD